MEREQTEKKYTWDTSDVFPDDEAWEKEYEEVKQLTDFSSFRGRLGDKQTLLAFFRKEEVFSRRVEKLYLYASMRHDEDVRVAKYIAYEGKMQSLYTEYASSVSFFEPEILSLPEELLRDWAADPDFSDHDYTLSRLLAQKPHVLSEKEEKIMALAGEPLGGFREVFSMLDNADLPLPVRKLDGKKTQITHATYGLVMRSGSRQARKTCFKAYYGAYRSLINVITSAYAGNVKKDIFYKNARGYESCLSMALAGEDVSPAVYENLISSVHAALPVLHRYISLRGKILGVQRQHMYDIYVPLVEEADISLSYDEAYEEVVKGLAPLGEDYGKLLRRAHDERWIDVYENTGKRSGAYSTGVYDTHPYVLLNYQPTTGELFTIAHEMGHSIHTYKSNAAQPYAKSSYTIFLAEIASTVNEVLLLKHLYRNTQDKKLKKFLLNYYMDMFRTTLFRQTQFAEFEEIAHRKAESGEPLTRENLSDAYYALNKAYYGDGIAHDEEIALEWARIPHFYRSFYVYKYATGIVSAVSLARAVLSEGKPAVERYFRFLESGNKTCPVDILKEAGVDLTTRAPFDAAMREFEETLQAFERLQSEE